MSDAIIVDLARRAMMMAMLLGAPMLLTALVLGLIISLIQAVTQVQEQTLSFVPKLVAVGLVLALGGGWMGAQLLRFTEALWSAIPDLVP